MTHLETYLDCLKILPNEFQREFVLMGELDKKATMVQTEMEAMQQSILEAASKPNADKKAPGEPSIEDRLAHLRQLHQMSVDLHQEKLALAKQSRDMIVSYAARLDDDIELFKEELPPEALQEVTEGGEKKAGGGSSAAASMGGRGKENRGGGGGRKSMNNRRDEDEADEDEDEEMEEEEAEEDEEEYEEKSTKNKSQKKRGGAAATDKDEEIYCVCQQPSYGEMVGCDSESCRYQWFHLACVGMKKVPPVNVPWFCDECKSLM